VDVWILIRFISGSLVMSK